MSRGRRRAVHLLAPGAAALAVAVATLVAATTGEATSTDAAPACFGAASRDTVRPCHNRALRTRVSPSPETAVLELPAPCQPLGRTDVLNPCRFGFTDEAPRDDIALIGDSHATHWRSAVEHVAVRRHWRGTSITRSSCPLSAAAPKLPPVAKRQCARWNGEVVSWLAAHPEVHTVFLSAHSGITVTAPRGASQLAARTRGYSTAMQRLPTSVSRVIVLRDTPLRRLRTLDCIEAAMGRKKPAGQSCAVPRGRVLRPDAETVAAHKLGGPRFGVADLSSYTCSARLCLPVIGGALVNRDGDHMTSAFSTSLGPYLLRRVEQLTSSTTKRGSEG